MKLLKMCEMKYGMIPEKKMFPIVTAILVILRRTLVQMRMMEALTLMIQRLKFPLTVKDFLL